MDFNNYLSPFSWRYGSPEMRHIWSEIHKRLLWRRIWAALAQAESEFGLVSSAQVSDLEQQVSAVDLERALQIEREIHHDLMAELKTFAEQAPVGGSILHLGATSMDIEDNADALRLRESLSIVLERLDELLAALAVQIERWADLPVLAFTHLQPAEPTTLGYRLAFYGQDLLGDRRNIEDWLQRVRGKGFKGAVGTAASYLELVGRDNFARFEAHLSRLLGLTFFPVTNQTYPRKQDYEVLSTLAGLGATLYKFAFDLRLLQSPVIGELSEPFGKKQVGSSAMPFKRNPINAEKIDSLARALSQMPVTAWNDAAHSLLERTLDDSANRRTLLPEAFLAADELLLTAGRIVRGLEVRKEVIQRNLDAYAPFAATERLLMALGKAGADRQEMHERLRGHSLAAWEQVQQGKPNRLAAAILEDPEFTRYLPVETIRALLTVEDYLGIAPRRAREIAREIRETVQPQ